MRFGRSSAAKQRNVTEENREKGWGDVWTWVAIDPDTKLAVSYRVGTRDLEDAINIVYQDAGDSTLTDKTK